MWALLAHSREAADGRPFPGVIEVSQPVPVRRPVPVPPSEIRVESVGVRPLDARRVDVAVDLAPCRQPVTVELVIVGPDDDELSSILLLDNTEWMLDKVMHVRRDLEPGVHTLHIGVFHEDRLVARASRPFRCPEPGSDPARTTERKEQKRDTLAT